VCMPSVLQVDFSHALVAGRSDLLATGTNDNERNQHSPVSGGRHHLGKGAIISKMRGGFIGIDSLPHSAISDNVT